MNTLNAIRTLWTVIVLTAAGTAEAGVQAETHPEALMRRQAVQKVEAGWKKGDLPARRSVKVKSGARCLPSCDITDGRFFAIAGANFQTLNSADLDLEISAPAGTLSLQFGVFDGDGGEYQSDGMTASWDSGDTADFEYTLMADPQADGSGTQAVEIAPGFKTFPSSLMPDNDWIDFTVATGPEAQAPSGNYFYVLHISLVDRSVTTLNAFKVRSSTLSSGLSLIPTQHPFSYIASWTSLNDISIVYPNFPESTPTTYDGTFRFYFDVPTSLSQLIVWDGDLDHGDYDLTDPDTDDPDTPNAPFRPPWSTRDVRPEGIAQGVHGSTGDPADDENPSDFGIFIVRPPAARYDLHFPDGRKFANENPSGNLEWEQFKISTAPFDRSQMDYSTSTIPPGIYSLTIQGVDMLNLNALLFSYRVLCVDEAKAPCQNLPRPYRIGDTVFRDNNGNGTQDSGEMGIAGVVLELRDTAGVLLGTATTDGAGQYKFEVEAGEYQVVVAASNFGAGHALFGYAATTPEQHTDTVFRDNVLIYDFGFRATGSLGDRVWFDRNGNGLQDPTETGLSGVAVELRDSLGALLGQTTTGLNGMYLFTGLPAGSYSVHVVASTLPPDAVPSYDLDGIATPGIAAATLAPGQSRVDVDFGYRGSVCELTKSTTGIQILSLDGKSLFTALLSADGTYLLPNLPAGSYRIRLIP